MAERKYGPKGQTLDEIVDTAAGKAPPADTTPPWVKAGMTEAEYRRGKADLEKMRHSHPVAGDGDYVRR